MAEYTGDINDLQLHLLNTAVYRRAYSLHTVGLVQFTNYITVHFKTMSLNLYLEASPSSGAVDSLLNLSM